MAKDNKTSKATNKQKQGGEIGNKRIVSGFIIMLLGIYLLSSILAYLFNWKEDMSAIAEIGVPTANPHFKNVCGMFGAVIANAIVGKGFGFFALMIPVALIYVGYRFFNYRELRLYRHLMLFAILLLLGSVTMGYVFDTKWSIYGTGLGGGIGVSLSDWFEGLIGGFGMFLLLVVLWVPTIMLMRPSFLRDMGSAISKGYDKANNYIHKRGENGEVDDMVDDALPEVGEPMPFGEDDDIYEELEKVNVDDVDVEPSPVYVAAATSIAEPVDDRFVVEPLTEDERGADESLAERTELEGEDSNVMEPIEVDNILGIEDNGGAEVDNSNATDGSTPLVVKVQAFKPKDVDEEDAEMELYDPMLDLNHYTPPTPQLLVDHKSISAINEEEIFRNKERIRETLLHFHVPIISMTATVGPTVTLYEIVQEPGVKISRIQGLEDDLAQNLKAQSVRIIAPMPGKGTVGIEVPNDIKQTVSMRSSICSEEFQNSKAELPVVIGRTIQNENYTFDLAKLPHLLVAGATGQGKSVGLNAIITSLLYRKHPAELKFVLIDPKMVEFSLYNKLEKHFLAKMESEDESIVTDPKKAVYTLNALCTEMANRLELCKKAAAKNIVEYNDKFTKRQLNPENGHRFLPYIVVVIDEFADLIMTAKEVEAPVMRLAQKARAIGIHLIVATQRPDVKVITGGIKANFPARIAFRVMQMTDSRTIIDQPGANQLIGRGDMLFLSGGEPIRIQCAFVDTPEVERIVDHIGKQQGYTSAYNLPDYTPEAGSDVGVGFGSEESSAPQKYDPKFAEIAREAVSSGVISTSMIQRNFEVGFNRAGRIMLQLERAGIVGPQIGSKQREIRFYDLPSLEARLQELGVS